MIAPARGLAYCRGRLKRCVDVALSLLGLALLSPLFLLVAVLLAVTSGRPIYFRHERVGLGGRPFCVLKFRTMRSGPQGGLPITGRGDVRVTTVGRLLRASKLDELPQLVNVLGGDMSLVGPRPEVPRYVALYTSEQRRVLKVRPGLTDPATILFRDEEALLGAVPDDGREEYYVSEVLPRKLRINLDYLDRAGFIYDMTILARTVAAILRAPGP